MQTDAALNRSVDVIGIHYPRGRPDPGALELGKKLWASESLTTSADWAGTTLWAETLNQNFVRMNATSAISWSLIWSVYPSLICDHHGLMDAMEPWSGYFRVAQQMWITAHTTLFTKVGWRYATQGAGSGFVQAPGTSQPSFVSLISPDKKLFATVVEWMSNGVVAGTKAVQQSFQLLSPLPQTGELQVWVTNRTVSMQPLAPILVKSGGMYTLPILPLHVYTVTNVKLDPGGLGGGGTLLRNNVDKVPKTAPLKLPFSWSFDDSADHRPGLYMNDQGGSFEVLAENPGSGNKVLQQMVQQDPIVWGHKVPPTTIFGPYYQNYVITANAKINANANAKPMPFVGICGRLGDPSSGFGFTADTATCLKVNDAGEWRLTSGGISLVRNGSLAKPPAADAWLTLRLEFSGCTVVASVGDTAGLATVSLANLCGNMSAFQDHGNVVLVSGQHPAQFDDVELALHHAHPVSVHNVSAGDEMLAHSTYHGGHRRFDYTGEWGAVLEVATSVSVSALARFVCGASSSQPHTLSLVSAQTKVVEASVLLEPDAPVNAAGFAFAAFSIPVTISAGKYYLLSTEVAGTDCGYGYYTDSCGGNSGGLPLMFSDIAAPVQFRGGVYKDLNGFVEMIDAGGEYQRSYGPVNAVYNAVRSASAN